MQSGPPDGVLEAFSLAGGVATATQPGNVHDTHVVSVADGRFVVQRVNTSVFADPEALMANAVLTAECLGAVGTRSLDYRRTREGGLLAEVGGEVWRSYRYVQGMVIERPVTAEEAFRIGQAFGRFDAAMAVHPPRRWHTVVPRYHDQAARVAALDAAAVADRVGRLDGAVPTLGRLRSVLAWLDAQAGRDAWQEAPSRVAHHDAKGVNLVFGHGGAPVVLDLDTVMAGTILSDIGELVRTCARPTEEGAPFDLDIGVGAVRGFVDGWGLGLDPAETAALPVAGVLMTSQNAVRFLTDHLEGDTYYRVTDPGRNLERARVMVAHAEAQIAAHAAFAAAVLSNL